MASRAVWGGHLDEGDGRNRLPAARSGAPACGVDGDSMARWTGGGRYFKYRPALGPREPSDQTPAAQIGPGLWSPARSFRSAREQELAGRDAALRRCRCRRLSPVEDAGQLAASAFQTRGSSRKRDGQPADFGGCPRAAASSGKETAGALRHQHCWPLTVRSSSALERTLDRMQCDEQPAHMCLHNLQRQVYVHPHAWIS